MYEKLGAPEFKFSPTGGTAVEYEMQKFNNKTAYKITAKEQTDIIFTKDAFGEAVFEKGKYLIIPAYFDEPHSFNVIMRFYENYGKPGEIHSKVAYGLLPGFVHYITVDLRILDMTIPSQPRVPESPSASCRRPGGIPRRWSRSSPT